MEKKKKLFRQNKGVSLEHRGRFRLGKKGNYFDKTKGVLSNIEGGSVWKKRKLNRQNKGSSSETRGRFRMEKKGNYCDKTKGVLPNIEGGSVWKKGKLIRQNKGVSLEHRGYEKKRNCFVKYLRKRERM
jgi:hypothetical protein